MQRRVVITGIGVVSPVGIGLRQFWDNVLSGVSGVDRCPTLENADCGCKIAGEVKDFRPEEWLGRKDARRMDRFAHFGLVAAHLAIVDAKLNLQVENPERVGVVTGTAFSGLGFYEREYGIYKEHGSDAMSPYASIGIFTGSCGAQISIRHNAKAPSYTIGTGCECSTSAIGLAADMIVRGEADLMFAGGTDAPIQPAIVSAFVITQSITSRNDEPTRASRPFDRKRDGFVMSEGGCILILEELGHARRRGARIYAELTGWASTCDAYHMCHPSPDGDQAVRALRVAMMKAGVSPSQIDYLSAHGSSTPVGDKSETLVIKTVFGEHAYNLPVSSIKASLGHTQGACGAIELAACCLAIRDNVIPPTINYEYPDPECDLDYVPNIARHRRVDVAVNSSLGFGGRNAALVVERYRDTHASGSNGGNGRPETHENGPAAH